VVANVCNAGWEWLGGDLRNEMKTAFVFDSAAKAAAAHVFHAVSIYDKTRVLTKKADG